MLGVYLGNSSAEPLTGFDLAILFCVQSHYVCMCAQCLCRIQRLETVNVPSLYVEDNLLHAADVSA